MDPALTDLENRIRSETAAARAALRTALQHAANVGAAYGAVQELLTQSQVQAWLAGPTCPVGRHDIMTCRRISMCNLDAMARTRDARRCGWAYRPQSRHALAV
jgi:hypothetical protein